MTDTATVESANVRGEPDSNRKARPAPARERAVWQPITSGWRRLYGGFYDLGVSIEWHNFELARTFAWSRSFHPESLELCLNLAGYGSVRHGQSVVAFEPLTAGFYSPGKGALQSWRESGQQHRFVTVEFASDFLRDRLAGCDG